MSRYDDFNLNSGQYVPQYAGTPLEEVQKTNEALDTRHYRNIADLSNLELLKQQYASKVTPGAKDYINTQFTDIDQTLKDIAANGAENSTAKISTLRNRFLGDQGVLGAMQRSEEIKKEVELENQLIAQGKQPIRKKGVREQALNTPVINPETGKLNDLYTQPYQSTVTPYENPVPYMKDIWAELHPDSIEGELKGIKSEEMKKLLEKSLGPDGVDMPLFFESLTKAGLDKTKIKDNLDNAFASYKETPAYKQAVEYSDHPEVESARQKDIFLKHGLLKTFQNLSRQYTGNMLADDLVRNKKGVPNGGGTNPDLAVPIKTPSTPIDNLSNINENGEVHKGFMGRAIDVVSKTRELADLATQSLHASTDAERKEIQQKYDKLSAEISAPDEQLTKEAVPYYRAAASFSNNPNMNEDQLKKWAGSKEGKQMLEAYHKNFLEDRYKSPFIENIDPEKARDAYNLFINSSLSQRKVIPFDNPTKIIHMSDIALGKGDDDALNINKWYINDPSKIRFSGIAKPQNWLGEGTELEGEFTNAYKIEVPEGDGKSGKMKTYYLSNLPSETTLSDMSEKALSNLGQKIPGVPNKSAEGVEVFQTLNPNQVQNTYDDLKKQGSDLPQILKWSSVVTVKYGDDIIVAPNYATAALELAKKGKYLTSSK